MALPSQVIQLSLRVYFLRHGETAAVIAREEEQIKDMIQIYKRLVLAERELQLTSHTYRTRTYTTKSYNHFVPPPDNISKENMHELFEAIILQMKKNRIVRQQNDSRTTLSLVETKFVQTTLREQLCQVGAKVKIRWTVEEIGDAGWRAGWYIAYVQGYDEESDGLTVQYPSEPGCTYTIDLNNYIFSNKIQLVQAVI